MKIYIGIFLVVLAVAAGALIFFGNNSGETWEIFSETLADVFGFEKENQISTIELNQEYFDVVHEGMKKAVEHGTAVALNVPYVEVAAKTGTAQLGAEKNRVNSWVIGFFPYEVPRYAFAVVMERVPRGDTVRAALVIRELIDWLSINAPEYLR